MLLQLLFEQLLQIADTNAFSAASIMIVAVVL